MGKCRRLGLAGILVMVLAAPAAAADYEEGPIMEAPPAQASAPVAIGSGWYLRGDIGYVHYGEPSSAPYGAAGIPPLLDAELSDTYSFGAGIGYKFGPWLRVDATADYRFDTKLDGRRDFVPGAFYTTDHARFDSATVLLNGYLDLGTWWGVTPYIGGGVGFAANEIGRYDVYALGNPGAGTNNVFPSDAHVNFAWALMAGASFDAGGGLALDLGYRYVNLGAAQTKLDPAGFGAKIDDLSAHEVRAGVRWTLSTPAAPVRPASTLSRLF